MVPRRQFNTLLAGAAALLLAVPATAQERGSVTGQVTDATSMRPLSGVQVVVEGTNLGGLTNENGRYLLTNVPLGERTIRAVLIGYEVQTATVTVTAGEAAVADFSLAQSAIALDAVVVTATGEQRKRELGHAISTVNAEDVVDAAPINSMSSLLKGRSAGVTVSGSAGSPGMGSRIRIRGSSSINLSNEPLIYLDGVRVSNSSGFSLFSGGQESSRLDDLNPEDIESIEIVKGPAAATLYGTEAANGVIRIKTKRGQAGATRWNFWAEAGVTVEPNDYPLNHAGLDADNPFGLSEFCINFFIAQGFCEQDGISSYQVLDDPVASPKSDGTRQQYGASVSGGSDNINYYVSAEWETEEGPWELPQPDREELVERGIEISETTERPQQFDRFNLRANLNSQLSDEATLAVRAGYVTQNLSMTGNDNNSFGFLPSAFFGGAFPERDGWGFQRPAQLFGRDFGQDVERFTSSGTATWNPVDWLQGRATVGIDYTNRHDFSFFARGLGVPGDNNLGEKDSNYINLFVYTVDASANASFDLTPRISSKTAAGLQFFRNLTTGTTTNGNDIVNGSSSVGSAANTLASEFETESKTLGLFVEQQFGFNDRLFVTGAIRTDDNSAFGTDFDAIVYPKVSASWIPSEEEFFPDWGFLDQLRVRGAWGESGLQPGTNAALQTLSPLAVTTPQDRTVSGSIAGATGNPNLEPERSSEIELGFDADMFGGRLGLEYTYYDKNTEGTLIQRPLPPSLGTAGTQWVNLGESENKGHELALGATILNLDDLQWDLNITGSVNENTLLELGLEEPIGTNTRFIEGFPLGGQWDFPYTWDDANGDGIIFPTELDISDELEFIGPGLPERELSISTNFTLWDHVRVYGLVDHQGDFITYNLTEDFRCRFLICRGIVDPNAPLQEQARATAAALADTESSFLFYEDGDFWKLREVSVSFFLPDSWIPRARRASVTLTGRNLATWTDYSGIDPEVNSAGASDNFGTTDFLTQPPIRYWTVRFNFNF